MHLPRTSLASPQIKRLEAARKRIERDLVEEEVEAERQLIAAITRAEEAKLQAKKQAITEAVAARDLAAKEEAERILAEEMAAATVSGWLYKRGGVAKLWRKR